MLQSRLVGNRNQWTSTVMTWSRLQGELAAATNAVKSPSRALGVTGRREEEKRSEEGEKCLVECRKRACELREEQSGDKRLKTHKQTGIKAQKKRENEDGEGKNLDATLDLCVEKNTEKVDPPIDGRRDEDADAGMTLEFRNRRRNGSDTRTSRSVPDLTTAGLEHDVESSSRAAASESVENGKKVDLFFLSFDLVHSFYKFICLAKATRGT